MYTRSVKTTIKISGSDAHNWAWFLDERTEKALYDAIMRTENNLRGMETCTPKWAAVNLAKFDQAKICKQIRKEFIPKCGACFPKVNAFNRILEAIAGLKVVA